MKTDKKKLTKSEYRLGIGVVSGSADDEIYIIDPNTVNYNPYEDRC